MNSKDETFKVLTGMRTCEKLLFEMYTIFSSKFTEYYKFWHDISIDENTHAFMVDTFISLYKSEDILFENRKFTLTEVNKDIEKIESFKKIIAENNISLLEALQFAVQIESSIIEKDLYQYQDTDPPEFKQLLITLNDDSKKHYHKIKYLYDKVRKEGLG